MPAELVTIDSDIKENVSIDHYGLFAYKSSAIACAGLSPFPVLSIHSEHFKTLHNNPENGLPYVQILQDAFKLYAESLEKKVPRLFQIQITPCLNDETTLLFPFIGIREGNIEALLKKYPWKMIKQNFSQLLVSYAIITTPKFHHTGFLSELTQRNLGTEATFDLIKNDLTLSKANAIASILKTSSANSLKLALTEISKSDDFKDLIGSCESQIVRILSESSRIIDAHNELFTAVILPQPETYLSEPALVGYTCSHNIQTGEQLKSIKDLEFIRTAKNAPITKNNAAKEKLIDAALALSNAINEIVFFKFFLDGDSFICFSWERAVNTSFLAELKHKLSLNQSGSLSDRELVTSIVPERISELLHPIFDKNLLSAKIGYKTGIIGSPGCASGRVYFSADQLIKAYEEAVTNNQCTDFILAMQATYADEVKAIKLSRGVISGEGGYASHAPVVARSLNKVSLVSEEIKFDRKSMSIGNKIVKEGDWLSINCPYGADSEIFFEQLPFTFPDFRDTGLVELIKIAKQFLSKQKVYCNADQGTEAAIGLELGADGIGLCRTEHMFFDKSRLPLFVAMILATDIETKKQALNELEKIQINDFKELLKIYEGKPVTIRLLDAPLHEFLPTRKDQFNEIHQKLAEFSKNNAPSVSELEAKAKEMTEKNPMLGCRGLRIGIMSPLIYEMQTRAIIKAACDLQYKGVDVNPRILVPMVIDENELKHILYGKTIEGSSIKGLVDTCEEILESMGLKGRGRYEIGAMIETPSASMYASEIAKHCSFISFGTNDLTQTVLALSRDDSALMLSEYQKYDIMGQNPFQSFHPAVESSIKDAIQRARMTRPDIVAGICGEHGANPENIPFLIENSFDTISAQPYRIPIITLYLAKRAIENG